MKKSFLPIIAMLAIAIMTMSSSCHKVKPGKAEITVLDSADLPVYGATVYLNSNNNTPPGKVSDKKLSDHNGKTYHQFDLECILQVEVNKGTLVAPIDHIHIIPGETATLTVTLPGH